MKIQHDVHMHTYLSRCCHEETFLPAGIIEKAKRNGIKLLGFSDHFWDKTMPGGDDEIYKNQDYENVNKIHDLMPENIEGIKILFGCETEYYGDGLIGISKQTAQLFDYVLVPTNHHLVEFAKRNNLDSPTKISEELLKRFKEVLSFDVATGICHPFLPIGFIEWGDQILNAMPEQELLECFGMAKEKGVSVELNACTFASNYNRNTDGFTDDSFLRIFAIAKKAGCKFHFGSDAHSFEDMDILKKLEKQIKILGITEEDIHPMFRT